MLHSLLLWFYSEFFNHLLTHHKALLCHHLTNHTNHTNSVYKVVQCQNYYEVQVPPLKVVQPPYLVFFSELLNHHRLATLLFISYLIFGMNIFALFYLSIVSIIVCVLYTVVTHETRRMCEFVRSVNRSQNDTPGRDIFTVKLSKEQQITRYCNSSLQTTDNLFTWGHNMPHFAAHSRIITLSSEVKLM